MATSCNTGYSEIAKFCAGEAYDSFKYIAVGTGTGQGAANSKLAAETIVADMVRVAGTTSSEKTTETDDTYQMLHKFTAGAAVHVKEAGCFNNSTKDLGDMLMVGDLATSADMLKDDTITLTMKVQVKAD